MAIALLCGCAPSPLDEHWIESRPLGADLESYRPGRGAQAAAQDGDSFVEPTGELTLRDALAAALVGNPELAAVAWDVRVAEAQALQAGLWPNPELEIETEEFGRTGAHVFGDAEYAVRLSQPIITAGKIAKQRRVAELGRDIAGWDYETQRLDVLTDVVLRFTDVLVAQRRLAVARDMHRLAQQVHDTVAAQVQAGAATPVQQTRAQVQRSAAAIEQQQARRALDAARAQLAATWGAQAVTFDQVRGDLTRIDAPPSLDALAAALNDNPDLARWATQLEQGRAAVELAEAQATPDVTVGAGVQHFGEANATAAMLSLSVPLPIFDRHQGGILEARYALGALRQRQRAAEAKAHAALAGAWHRLQSAHEELQTLDDQTLPAATQAYDAVRRSFEQGKLTLLDVLDAQSTQFELQQRHVDALRDYHHAAAEIERLVGRSLNDINQDTP
jgi:cobalt-zinc-cadmium efflux system outer membrane protein